jgi:hypothetical protein
MVCTSTTTGSRIAGGFVLLNVAALVTAWRACRARPLGIGDFRAWLACHELMARRCTVNDDRAPAYTFVELAKLLKVTERRARASVRRLGDAGLIEWSDEAIGFPDNVTNLGKKVDEAGQSPDPNVVTDGIKDSIGGGKGSLAIPRRMLRFLADGARPALIATVLGLLLRCLSRRKAGFDGRGRVKASWIARTFGVSLRQVKAARRELVALGWIEAEPGDQWAENRWGRAFRIDIGWKAPDFRRKGACQSPFPGATSAPLPAIPGPSSAPPDLHQEPSLTGGSRNQEPAGGPSGFSIKGREKEGQPPAGPLPAPKLADVRPEDIKDTGRLLDLHRQAVAKGLVTASEADRLKFIGGAEHALAIATNPAALFAWLVLKGCWRYLTQADEDRANARLKAHLRGPDPAPLATSQRVFTMGIPLPTSSPPSESPGAGYTACTPPPRVSFQVIPFTPPASAPPRVRVESVPLPSSRPIEPGGLSEDARIVKAIREATIRAGIYRDPFPEFSARYPEWTRPRWDAALADLGLPVPGR